MTRRKLDSIVDEIVLEVAKAHGLNTIPEPKGGELGDAYALFGRAIAKAKFDIVRATGATIPIVVEN